MKYIIITGGVSSSIGKGITSSSIGVLLKLCGMKVSAIKIDPYLNVDAGTMSPFQHGECYVLDDGSETDLDLGNYERFLNVTLTKDHSITSGKVYNNVINKERNGNYLGQTVQLVPHVSNEIIDLINHAAKIKLKEYNDESDITIIELGGTVGDIEGLIFLEAIRQMKYKQTHDQFIFIHTCLLPLLHHTDEYKTKPIQQSVSKLKELGISPDILCIRCKMGIDADIRDKISLFCEVKSNEIIINKNVSSIYEVPILFSKQNIINIIFNKFNLNHKLINMDLSTFKHLSSHFKTNNIKYITIGIIGKYIGTSDTYLSIEKALEHSSIKINSKIIKIWIDSDKIYNNDVDEWNKLKKANCIIIPGGFGIRGVEGIIKSIKYCRENNKPILGICMGFQLMVIEYLRYILNNESVNSLEYNDKSEYIITQKISDNNDDKNYGATMRLGIGKIIISKNSKTYNLYKSTEIYERHRHRYEINPKYINTIESKNLKFIGKDQTENRMEILELNDHVYFIGCQFHPELKSRYNKSNPLFDGLLNTYS